MPFLAMISFENSDILNYIYFPLQSGPDRGRCDCGKCVCNANYTGEACECAVSTADCQKDNGVSEVSTTAYFSNTISDE